jgi:hypothetical protein
MLERFHRRRLDRAVRVHAADHQTADILLVEPGFEFAVAEGAERVMGMLCGCRHPFGSRPRWSSILAQSFSLAIQAKFQCDLRVYRSQTEVHILKPCPGPDLGLLEFDRAWTLIEPAYQHALRELQRDLTGISEGRRGNSKEVV